MLRLDGIEIDLGGFRLNADVSVPEGARVAIMGPSGAGKSTLLSVIAGFLTPDRGCILWRGDDLTPLAPGDRPISVVFQDQNLFPHLTVSQNVALGLRPSLRLTEAERAQTERALLRTGLAGLGDRLPGQLSGGQQSRVALARMLLRARPLVLLDEPFSALGPALRVEMLDLVMKLTEETGATLVMVTHDPEDARRIATHIMLVDEGQIDDIRETGPLFADPPEAFRRYLG